jgi:hypothetical protein
MLFILSSFKKSLSFFFLFWYPNHEWTHINLCKNFPNESLSLNHAYQFMQRLSIATPLWRKCEVTIHTPENGSLESSGTPENSKDDCKGQNTLHWWVLYTFGKVLKCRCPKWPYMSHLDIFSPSYGQKKGRESNWQFDS